MTNTTYECRRCGRPFQVKEGEKEPQCLHCASKDVVVRPARPVTPPSCGREGRFT